MSTTSDSDSSASAKKTKDHYRKALEDTIAEDNFSADATRARVARFERQDRNQTRNSFSPSSESLESVNARDPLYRPALNRVQYPGKSRTKRYEIGAVLGRGGSGQVFAARDLVLGRDVAVKVLYPDIASDPVRMERFVNEARITAKLEHPYILPVYDLEVPEDGNAYFTMRVASGLSLGEALRRAAAGDPPRQIGTIRDRLNVFLKVLDALAFAHNQGVIHQDIKPDNIMLGEYGEVLVVDWGTAIAREGSETKKDRLIGTPAYMSPEQARRERADERSDVYGLGATLFQMLTLRHATWESDPDAFWKKKREGTIDPPTEEERAHAPAHLLEIATRALAPEPNARYQTVNELRKAIEEYQQYAESINLQVSARETLDRAVTQQDYALFNQALFGFQEALKLWNGNAVASQGLSETKLRYSECALAKGDLELAASTLNPADPAHERTLRRISEVRRDRARTRRRVRVVQAAAATFAVLLVGFIGYYTFDYFRYFGQWKSVYTQDFAAANADVKSLFFSATESWDTEVPPPPRGPHGVNVPGGALVWLRDLRLHGDVRMEAKMRWTAAVDGFELFMNASHEQENSGFASPAGYTCQFGGYNNTLNFIAPQEHSGTTNRASAIAFEFKPGQVYTLAFQCEGEELSIWVDGTPIHRQVQVLPVTRTGFDYLGFRSWQPVELLSLNVARKTIAEKSSPLVAGDALYKSGHHEEALRVYRELSLDFADQPIGEQALARAYLMTYYDAEIASHADVRSDIRNQMLREYPDSRYWSQIFEADCISAWRNHNYADALALLPTIFRRDADTRILLRILEEPHQELPPEVGAALLTWAPKTTNVFYLYLDSLGLHTLAPIAGMKLTRLDCANNALTTLEPLRGMPLKAVDFGMNMVSDLEPLRGMRLTLLRFSRNRIRSLEPLAGMPLQGLHCSENEITSLEPLRGMAVGGLLCNHNHITSLEPLTGMHLGQLDVGDNEIADISPVKGMPMGELYLDNNKIVSLEPLRDSKLVKLSCRSNKISDLGPLEHLNLRELLIDDNAVSDLKPLSSMPLSSLSCSKNKIADLAPLRGTQISGLIINENPLTDLSPLEHLPLQELEAGTTSISNLDPLKELALTKLIVINTSVSDLSKLNGAKMERLYVNNTQVRDLAKFAEKPPRYIVADWENWDDAHFDAMLKNWELAKADPKTLFRVRIARLGRLKQFDKLKAMSTAINGHHYLLMPLLTSYPEAVEIAQLAGGHLVTLSSAAEQAPLIDFLWPVEDFWIGLNCGPTGETWVTGEPVNFHNNSLNERVREGPRVMFQRRNDPHWITTTANDPHMSVIEWDN